MEEVNSKSALCTKCIVTICNIFVQRKFFTKKQLRHNIHRKARPHAPLLMLTFDEKKTFHRRNIALRRCCFLSFSPALGRSSAGPVRQIPFSLQDERFANLIGKNCFGITAEFPVIVRNHSSQVTALFIIAPAGLLKISKALHHGKV